MERFSQRYGYAPKELPFQKQSLNQQTRQDLWNQFSLKILRQWDDSTEFDPPHVEDLLQTLWISRPLGWDVDQYERDSGFSKSVLRVKRAFFEKMDWMQVYDFLEAVVENCNAVAAPAYIAFFFNEALESNNTDHRFFEGKLVPYLHADQLDAISAALDGDVLVATHLRQAMALLADREKPDYRNSVKESISAVECLCGKIAEKPKATLGEALKKIPQGHPAFKDALAKLYGYTSDEGGIRHSLTEDSQPVDKADAMFMLVACSAFTSYLNAKASGAS